MSDVHVYVRSHISYLMKHYIVTIYHSCSHVVGLWIPILLLQYFWVIVLGSLGVPSCLSLGGNYVLFLEPYWMMGIIFLVGIVVGYDMLMHGRMLLSLSNYAIIDGCSVVLLYDGDQLFCYCCWWSWWVECHYSGWEWWSWSSWLFFSRLLMMCCFWFLYCWLLYIFVAASNDILLLFGPWHCCSSRWCYFLKTLSFVQERERDPLLLLFYVILPSGVSSMHYDLTLLAHMMTCWI